jgi:hypothetical protein
VFLANIVNPSPNGNFYFSPTAFGDPSSGGMLTAVDQVGVPIPVACTFNTIYLSTTAVQAGYGTGGAITVTLVKNGTTQVFSATGSNAAAAVTSGTGSVSVAAGDLVALYGSGAGFGSGTASLSVSLQCQ